MAERLCGRSSQCAIQEDRNAGPPPLGWMVLVVALISMSFVLLFRTSTAAVAQQPPIKSVTPAGLLAGPETPTMTLTAVPITLTVACTPEGTPTLVSVPSATPTLSFTVTVPGSSENTPKPTPTVGPTLTAWITPAVPPSLEDAPTPTATQWLTPAPVPTPVHILAPQVDLEPVPTPPLPPPVPTDEPVSGDPHVAYSATTASCAACHRAHTAQGWALRGIWPEEWLCLSCHGSDGPGTDVAQAFDYENTITRVFEHDVSARTGVHRVGESLPEDFAGRHVECEDCHEPHEATRGLSNPPSLQREMTGASGVDPVWTAPGAPSGYLWMPKAEREYQVCFKCHSSFTTLPTYVPDGWNGETFVSDGLRKLTSDNPRQVADSRDMAQEFNPYQASFHPVVAQGRNQSIAGGAFVAGWSSTSIIYCSDCHRNPNPLDEGEGPHGSPLLHILAGLANYQTASPDAPVYAGTEVCFDCHDSADYLQNGRDSNFLRGNRNLHAQHSDNGSCYLCHDSHGSEQLHLLNLDLEMVDGSETYLLPGYDGLPTDSQSYWQISPDGSQKTCWLVCHGHDHQSSSYPNLSD